MEQLGLAFLALAVMVAIVNCSILAKLEGRIKKLEKFDGAEVGDRKNA